MNEFIEIVKERPNKKLKSHKCPFCGKKGVQNFGTTTTLVGGDNHTWTTCRCNKCGEEYTFETKGKNKWVTQNRKVKFGIPTCFESYIYTCNKCDGEVHREYLKLDSDEPVKYLSTVLEDGKYVNKYRTIFKCKDCEQQVQSENDYFYPESRIKAINKPKKEVDLSKWTLEIEDDMEVMIGVDVEAEIANLMSKDLENGDNA
jgi:predicted RNA-binding Zn-ribbon protein involved in translation (DUF1610 family)